MKVSFAQPNWYSILVAFSSSFVFAAVSVLISVHYADQSARQWCSIIVLSDDFYRTSPPPQGDNPRAKAQRDYAAAIHQRRVELGCRTGR